MRIPTRIDFYAGMAMVLLGCGAAVTGSHYEIGALSRMGPGFFPLALGVLLALIGAVIAFAAEDDDVEAAADAHGAAAIGMPDLRGAICIIAGVLSFIVLGRYGGLIPATCACVFVSAMGDRNSTVVGAAILAVVIAAGGAAIFIGALKLPFPLFTWG
jgi:hypothetical protein